MIALNERTYLGSPCLNEIVFIRFAIDTSTTITSISSVDAALNGIFYRTNNVVVRQPTNY